MCAGHRQSWQIPLQVSDVTKREIDLQVKCRQKLVVAYLSWHRTTDRHGPAADHTVQSVRGYFSGIDDIHTDGRT